MIRKQIGDSPIPKSKFGVFSSLNKIAQPTRAHNHDKNLHNKYFNIIRCWAILITVFITLGWNDVETIAS